MPEFETNVSPGKIKDAVVLQYATFGDLPNAAAYVDGTVAWVRDTNKFYSVASGSWALVDFSGGGSGLSASDIDTLAELNAILTDATLVDEDHTHTESDITDLGDYATRAPSLNAQSGTSYTLVLADADKILSFDNVNPITLTVPPVASVNWAGVGDGNPIIPIIQENSGAVTVAAGSGVTIHSKGGSLTTNGAWSTAALTYLGSNVWLLSGDLA